MHRFSGPLSAFQKRKIREAPDPISGEMKKLCMVEDSATGERFVGDKPRVQECHEVQADIALCSRFGIVRIPSIPLDLWQIGCARMLHLGPMACYDERAGISSVDKQAHFNEGTVRH